jgi:asparagine synthase (glutamine-hydrolysing)
LSTKLPRILRSCDRASMSFGRELRVPFLDHRLVEFAYRVPGHVKIEVGAQRRFMRQALERISQTALAKLPKHAVADPQREWLKEPLAGWVADTIHSRSFGQRGIFDAAIVRESFAAYRKAKRNENSVHIWQWMMVELWFQAFIDCPVAVPATA